MKFKPSSSIALVLVNLGAGLGMLAVAACASDAAPTAVNEPSDASSLPYSDASSEPEAAPADASCDACVPVDCATTDFCVASPPISSVVSLNAIWGSSATDVWIVGTRGTILHGDGTTFTSVPSGTDAIFFSLSGSSKDDVWINGPNAPMHSSDGGKSWEFVQGATWNEAAGSFGRISAVRAASNDDVWLAGFPTPRFGGYGSFWSKGVDSDGQLVWNTVDAYESDNVVYPQINAIWGAGPNDLWAVGEVGKAFRYAVPDESNPARWIGVETSTRAPLLAIWGSSASDVWAVGGDGTMRHLTGPNSSTFAIVDSITTKTLHGVWGSGPSDVWAVGDEGTILHFDGTAWTVADAGFAPGQTPDLFGVWGSGPGDVWIVGKGVLLHRTEKNRRHR